MANTMIGVKSRLSTWRALAGLAFIAANVALAGLPMRALGQTFDTASEQSIKAAYLYKFAAYVEWPDGVFDDPEIPLTIGIFGSNSLATELELMTIERTVNGRPIAVRRVQADDSLRGVHILFVAAAGSEQLVSLAAEARLSSALVVTEAGDALELGSVINFRPVDQRIRFEVSLEFAEQSRLRLSSRLLAVAAHVEPRRN